MKDRLQEMINNRQELLDNRKSLISNCMWIEKMLIEHEILIREFCLEWLQSLQEELETDNQEWRCATFSRWKISKVPDFVLKLEKKVVRYLKCLHCWCNLYTVGQDKIPYRCPECKIIIDKNILNTY